MDVLILDLTLKTIQYLFVFLQIYYRKAWL